MQKRQGGVERSLIGGERVYVVQRTRGKKWRKRGGKTGKENKVLYGAVYI